MPGKAKSGKFSHVDYDVDSIGQFAILLAFLKILHL